MRRIALYAVMLVSLAVLMRFGFERSFPSPRQMIYEKQNEELRSRYVSMDLTLQTAENQLLQLQAKDDRFYRSILKLDPVPSTIREAGTGGAERNQHLNVLRDPDMVKDVSHKLESIQSKANIQSNSLEDVLEEALDNQNFLACRPSIHPISPADPYWFTSGFGRRIDPITKRLSSHHGIDLAGPVGMDIHCTGEGTVIKTRISRSGYGNEVVVDHGYGYTSRYAHLDEIKVKKGDKVLRGSVVGTMGDTGRSTGPHLHYEIRKNGSPVNPVYFFFENLDKDEYTTLVTRAMFSI